MAESVHLDASDLGGLRLRLLRIGPDFEGATEVVQAYLGHLGYGISRQSARLVAERFGQRGCSLEAMRSALDGAAWMA